MSDLFFPVVTSISPKLPSLFEEKTIVLLFLSLKEAQ